MKPGTFDKIQNHLDKAKHVLLITDERPDGDTFGSSLAFAEYLRNISKKITHLSGASIPDAMLFLPNIETITHDISYVQKDDSIDLVIVFDSSRKEYLNKIIGPQKRNPIIVFDHHKTEKEYGTLNATSPTVASTCEIIYNYFTHHKIAISRSMAECLLTGLITDTHVLSNKATTSDTVHLASKLLTDGGKIRDVVDNMISSMSIAQLRLWGLIFERAVYSKKFNCATVCVTEKDLRDTETNSDDFNEVIDYLLSVLRVKTIFFIKERDNILKVSMRSTDKNVLQIARAFGGNGHILACGFSVDGKLNISDNKIRIL